MFSACSLRSLVGQSVEKKSKRVNKTNRKTRLLDETEVSCKGLHEHRQSDLQVVIGLAGFPRSSQCLCFTKAYEFVENVLNIHPIGLYKQEAKFAWGIILWTISDMFVLVLRVISIFRCGDNRVTLTRDCDKHKHEPINPEGEVNHSTRLSSTVAARYKIQHWSHDLFFSLHKNGKCWQPLTVFSFQVLSDF